MVLIRATDSKVGGSRGSRVVVVVAITGVLGFEAFPGAMVMPGLVGVDSPPLGR